MHHWTGQDDRCACIRYVPYAGASEVRVGSAYSRRSPANEQPPSLQPRQDNFAVPGLSWAFWADRKFCVAADFSQSSPRAVRAIEGPSSSAMAPAGPRKVVPPPSQNEGAPTDPISTAMIYQRRQAYHYQWWRPEDATQNCHSEAPFHMLYSL